MDGGHAHAVGLMRAERFGDAIPLLIAACGAANAGRQCWVDLGRCLIETEQHAGLLRLIDKRQATARDGLRLYHDCLAAALSTGRHEKLRRMIAATPRDSALFVVALYISGVVVCQGADARRGIEEIKLASAAAQSCAALFESDPLLASILNEGDVLENFETIAAIEATEPSAIFAEADDIAPAADFTAASPEPKIETPFVFLAGCSEPYLDRFGAGLVAALDQASSRTVLHFHVADPSSALPAKIAALQGRCGKLALRFSTETYRHPRQGYSRASFYACSRLIRLPEILAHYERDVMMWDMDAAAIHGLDRLVAAMRDSDLGYFAMANQRLPLICHLAVAYFKNNAAMRRCARLVSSYAALKLRQAPYWLLDQSSLFCVSRFLAAEGALRINDFSTNPGGAFERYVEIAGSAVEKQAMRNRAAAAPE